MFIAITLTLGIGLWLDGVGGALAVVGVGLLCIAAGAGLADDTKIDDSVRGGLLLY